jgi:hypothetical protein
MLERDQDFEADSLHRQVCEPSVPLCVTCELSGLTDRDVPGNLAGVVACSNCSRLRGDCGASRKAVSRAYSPLVSGTSVPPGSVNRRLPIELPAAETVSTAPHLVGMRRVRPPAGAARRG